MTRVSKKDHNEFTDYCRGVSDDQVRGIYRKELEAGRPVYARIAMTEALRRKLPWADGEAEAEQMLTRTPKPEVPKAPRTTGSRPTLKQQLKAANDEIARLRMFVGDLSAKLQDKDTRIEEIKQIGSMHDEALALPMIHLNGSSPDHMVEDLKQAVSALRNAESKIAQCYPHERDYYVQPNPETYKVARAQHGKRLEHVKKMIEDLTAIARHCLRNRRAPAAATPSKEEI